MNVFLVPVGNDRYELYCEPSEADQASRGVMAHLLRRVRAMEMAEQRARRDRRAARRGDKPKRFEACVFRARSGLTRGMVAWVGRQRLLWHLRHVAEATLVYPADLNGAEALSVAQKKLQYHREHHRFWMVVDGLGVLVFGPLFFFVPGPNLISWYFTVKMAGHWLAFLGARCGVASVEWSPRLSAALVALREVISFPRGSRRQRVRALSTELRLEHLVSFIERSVPDQP